VADPVEHESPLVGLPDVVPVGVADAARHADDAPEIVVETLREFRERELPPSQSLVGSPRDGTNLLPRFGWVMPWGQAGSSKTSILVDLLFHACSGIDWLGWHVERALRVVVIVNEGIPGALQDKLKQKLERWPHDTAQVLDNLSVWASPWGEFSFREQRLVEYVRDYALDHGADYVALDPLHTIATTNVGSPEETEAFKRTLRDFGVWEDLGVLTTHHANKAKLISGDWDRHPDTVLRLDKEPKTPATKLTLEKARPADPDELGVPVLLNWLVETLGYERVAIDTTTTGDDELLDRIKQTLADASEPLSMHKLKKATSGNEHRIGDVAQAALASGEISNVSTRKNVYALVLPERCHEFGGTPGISEAQMRMAEPEELCPEPEAQEEEARRAGEVVPRASLSKESRHVEAQHAGEIDDDDLPDFKGRLS
jgi:hypothetical protein